MITENLSTLKIHKLTKAQYERELTAGNIDENAIYLTPDEESDLSQFSDEYSNLYIWKTYTNLSNGYDLIDGTGVLYISKRGYTTDNHTLVYYSDEVSVNSGNISLVNPTEIEVPATSDGQTTAKNVLPGKFVKIDSKNDIYFIPSDANLIYSMSTPMFDIRTSTYQVVTAALEPIGFVTSAEADTYPSSGWNSSGSIWYVGGEQVGDALVRETTIVPIEEGGTGRSTIADTEYDVIKHRGSALVASETDPTENGTICWTYE